MQDRPTRREALVRLGLGSAGIVVATRAGFAAPRLAATDVAPLAQRFRACPRDGIYDETAKAIAAGASPEVLLAASFLAGVQDIRPHGVGGKFHAVLMVESAYQLLHLASPQDQYRIALFALWDFKRCQQRDRDEEGDWVLPPAPQVKFATEAAARREFLAGMDAWDLAQADRGIVGLLPYHDRESLFALLWRYGARCYADLGHKIIFCAHADRTLQTVGWKHAEPVLRSLIRGLLYVTDEGPEVAVWNRSLGQVDQFPASWQKASGSNDDPRRSLEVLQAMRGTDPAAAQQVLLDALKDDVGIATLWDGLRLRGAEVFYCRHADAERRHGPVHTVTELNAFGHVWRSTDDDELRKLVLLQLVGWIASLETDMATIFGEQRTRRVDALSAAAADAPEKAPNMAEVFERPAEAQAWAAIDGSKDGVEQYLAQLRTHLYERADQDHQFKFVAALHEEAAAMHPDYRSRLLAPAITYVPAGRDPRTEMRKRTDAALARAGIT